jgi:hypothetical protein
MLNPATLSTTGTDRQDDIALELWRALSGSLSSLLVQGGDDRLAIDPVSGLSVYGCSPEPRSGVVEFCSSTASSISEPAFRRVRNAREELVREAVAHGLLAAFDRKIDQKRQSLKSCLGLRDVDVVFAPSGTDAQLHALFIVRQTLGATLTEIVVAADQTGSGTTHTSRGRHFSTRTAQGGIVEKAAPIEGLADSVTSIGIPLYSDEGVARSPAEIDAAVNDAVGAAIAAGRKVVLQAMDSSKLGWRAPSDACLEAIHLAWPQSVQIVIDACQMRLGRSRLATYLDRGWIVLVTGSKFFMGPGFSGATLVPPAISRRLDMVEAVPYGLADYASRSDFPPRWRGIRAALADVPNFGQWLRWEAALEEMRAYFAVPASFRRSALTSLAAGISRLIATSRSLEFLAEEGGCPAETVDDEMPVPTIFPFLVKCDRGSLQHESMVRLYRALNRDSSTVLTTTTEQRRALAETLCHIGQPVKLPAAGGATKSVLRIGIGARTIAEAWSPDAATAEQNIERVITRCRTVVDKIEMIAGTEAL